MLYGSEIVPARILDTDAGNATRGHRFMAPQAFRSRSLRTTKPRCASAGKVIADFAERRALIREQVIDAGQVARRRGAARRRRCSMR